MTEADKAMLETFTVEQIEALYEKSGIVTVLKAGHVEDSYMEIE